MRKRLSTLAVAVILSLGVYWTFAAKTVSAQCGCSCAMVCGNRCEFACYGCTLSQAIDTAIACCEGAHAATGDTEACQASGPVS